MLDGKAFQFFLEEVQKTISRANDVPGLKPYAEALAKALGNLREVTAYLLDLAKRESPEVFLADATLYLDFFGIVSVAWQWLHQGIFVHKGLQENPSGAEAAFLQGKIYALRFFFAYELPRMKGLADRLMSADGLTVEMKPEHFSD